MVRHLDTEVEGVGGLVAAGVIVDEQIVHVAVHFHMAVECIRNHPFRFCGRVVLQTATNQENHGVLIGNHAV